jgi:rod shape-determining protein MreD
MSTAAAAALQREERAAVRRARLLPWASVLVASLVAGAVPVVASAPLLPPLGLLTLLAWRLLAPLSLRPWAPALLGLFDDLISGQPVGSAMLLWQTGFFLVLLADQRMILRDFVADWAIATVVIAVVLVGGRLAATPLAAHVDTMLVFQIVISVLLFPAAARLVAWIDQARGRA